MKPKAKSRSACQFLHVEFRCVTHHVRSIARPSLSHDGQANADTTLAVKAFEVEYSQHGFAFIGLRAKM